MKARIRRVVINPSMIFHIMETGSGWNIVKGIPKGSQLRGMTLDPYTQALNLFVEHTSFDEVDLNTVAPGLEILFKKQ